MKKFTKIATVAVMTMVTAGVFAGCGLKGGKDIGKEAALEAALADAGVRESDTTRLRVSSEIDDGRKVYEVRFDVEGTEYDYEISGRDGQILSADTERISTVDTTDRAGTTDTAGTVRTPGLRRPAPPPGPRPLQWKLPLPPCSHRPGCVLPGFRQAWRAACAPPP